MKQLNLLVLMLISFAGIAIASAPNFAQADDPCVKITMGKYTIDVSRAESSVQIPKGKLIESFKSGLKAVNTPKCADQQYEIVDMQLMIANEGNVSYQYNRTIITTMQSMDDNTLTRYFLKAQKLTFSNIKLRNSAGDVVEIPSVSFVIE